jgi:rod shape-determining protein MreC
MAIYTVGRRRVIIALLLSGVLLLTLDLRGNPVLDTVRDGFSRAMAPVEQATDVVTTPVQRAWNSFSNYDDLERENQALRDEIDRQRGTQAAAEASIIDYQLLLALNNLPSLSGIETAKAQVVGGATNNIDQIVEINKGSDSGISVGMPVVNQAGLIGKITQVNATTAKVMLITDPRYSIPVEILGGTGDLDGGEEPADTTPSGRTEEELDEIIDQSIADAEAAAAADSAEDATGTTDPDLPGGNGGLTPADVFEGDVPLPQAGDPNEATTTTTIILPEAIPAGEEAPVITDAEGNPIETPSTTTTTTTTMPLDPDQLEKEFGVLQGRGQGRPPQIRFLQDIPSLAVLQVGDLIETAGGSQSLAPPNIPVGRVINRANRPGVAGPLLEIELNADLDKLNFVRVVLFQPLTEVAE